MDKALGRFVFKVSGSVSANNFIEYNHLHLTSPYYYIQLKLTSKVATIHIEVVTKNGYSIRVTLSTLYSQEKPRFLGRSVRLPITLMEQQWTILSLDMNNILANFCITGSTTHSLDYVKVVRK